MRGTFVSVWDYGTVISTPAELNTTTGEITTESIDVDENGFLDREYFESLEFFNAGEEFEVCPECHNHIFKVEMKEGIGKMLYESKFCTNPDCNN